jgi:hypothetical protein
MVGGQESGGNNTTAAMPIIPSKVATFLEYVVGREKVFILHYTLVHY